MIDPVVIGGISPILRIADLAASVAYYTEQLGFAVDWNDHHGVAGLSRGKATVMLARGDQGHTGSWVWCGCDDAARLHEELLARGARIRQGPTNFDWALEIQVADLDGNVLRFGSEPLVGVSYGPWLDMHGDLWHATADGGWRHESRPHELRSGASTVAGAMHRLQLRVLPEPVSIVRLGADATIPDWALAASGFASISRTRGELSIVASLSAVPAELGATPGYRVLEVAGPLPLELVGIMAALAVPLAEAGVPIFPIATHDTDHLLVPAERLAEAVVALERAGHRVHPH